MHNGLTFRPTRPEDTEILVPLAERTGVFKPHEIVALREVLDDFHKSDQGDDDRAFTALLNDVIVGFVYYGPVAMTDNTWDLWWIAVDPKTQGKGIGYAIMQAAEADMRSKGGRLLTLDTSSTPLYESTRQFYLKAGYQLMATLPDYYSDGDGKCIFWKKL